MILLRKLINEMLAQRFCFKGQLSKNCQQFKDSQQGSIMLGLLALTLILAGTVILLNIMSSISQIAAVSGSDDQAELEVKMNLFRGDLGGIDSSTNPNTFNCSNVLGGLPVESAITAQVGSSPNSFQVGYGIGAHTISKVSFDLIPDVELDPIAGTTTNSPAGTTGEYRMYYFRVKADSASSGTSISASMVLNASIDASDNIVQCSLGGSLVEMCQLVGLSASDCTEKKVHAITLISSCKKLVVDAIADGTTSGIECNDAGVGTPEEECCNPMQSGSWANKVMTNAFGRATNTTVYFNGQPTSIPYYTPP